ncbi:MAG: hypothetical protein ACE5K4_09935 [Candidatus Hydrothermarchaeota archaeon]
MNIKTFEGKIVKTERKDGCILVRLINQQITTNIRIFSDLESLQKLNKLLNENIQVEIVGNLITQKSDEFYLDEPVGVYEKAIISGRVENFEVNGDDVRLILTEGEVNVPLKIIGKESKIDIKKLIGSNVRCTGYVPLCLIENGFHTYEHGKKPLLTVKNRSDFLIVPRDAIIANTIVSSILGSIVGIVTYLVVQSVGIMHTSYYAVAWLLPFIFGGITSSYVLKGEKIDSVMTGIGTGILIITPMIVLEKNGIYPFYSALKVMFPITSMAIIISFLLIIQSPVFSLLTWRVLNR